MCVCYFTDEDSILFIIWGVKRKTIFSLAFHLEALTWTFTFSSDYRVLFSDEHINGVLIYFSFDFFRREVYQFLNWPLMCLKIRSNKYMQMNVYLYWTEIILLKKLKNFIIVLLHWGYIVIFTKVLTIHLN
jgi:hypothetical protein